MGIMEGLALGQYLNELPQKQEEAKLHAQLFKSQAEHYDAQNQLLQMELLNQVQYQQATAPLRQALTQRQMGGMQPQAQPQPQDSLTAPWVTPPMAPADPEQARLPVAYGGTSTDPASMDEDTMIQMARQRALYGLKGAPELLNAAINNYKERQKAKQEQHFDYAGKLQNQYILEAQAAETNGGSLSPITEQWYRGAIAQSLHAAGKPDEARQFLAGKWQQLQPGAIGGRQSPTGTFTPQVVNPNTPVVPTTAGGGYGRGDVRGPILLGPEGQMPQQAPLPTSPPGPARAPVQVSPPQTTTVPEPNASEIAQMTQQLIAAGMAPEEAQRTAPIVLRAMTPVPAPTTPAAPPSTAPTAGGGTAPGVTTLKPPASLGEVAAADEQARLNKRVGRKPGEPDATAADVTTIETKARRRETAIPKEAAEAIGVPEGTTYGAIEDGKVKPESGSTVPKQLPTGKERDDLGDYEAVIQLSQGLVQQLKTNPKAAELLGGWFVDPGAAWKRLRSRQGAAASAEGRAFLAEYGIAAAQLRAKLIGLAQTNREMGGLVDAIPDPSAGSENIVAGLQSIIKTTTVQRDTKIGTQQGLGVKTPTGSAAPKGPTPGATPKDETAEQQAERIRQKYNVPTRKP